MGGWVDLGAPYLVGNEGMKKTRREMRVEEEVVVGGGGGGLMMRREVTEGASGREMRVCLFLVRGREGGT